MADDELAKIRDKKMQELRDRFDPSKRPAQPAGHVTVIPVDEVHFSQILQQHPALVIDFWAEWCGPCRRVAPVVEELAQEFAGKVTFAKCDTDHNQRLAMKFGISAIPCLLFFSNGQMVDRLIGAVPKESIRAKVVRNFGV
jgi:thioredoxin 1